jgi:hypothetical protein
VADLFNSPVLVIEQPSPHVSYQITDPQGAVLAHANQVGGQQKSAFRRFFSTGDTARLVVQVSGPDGTPLFSIDRAPQQQVSAIQPPCAIMAPNGAQLGRVEHNAATLGHHLAAGLLHMQRRYGEAENMGEIPAYTLIDAANQPLCRLTPEAIKYERQMFDSTPNPIGRRFFTYTDMNQVPIARLNNDESGDVISERTELQLQFQLPDPLRVLVIASPIAIDIMVAATQGS